MVLVPAYSFFPPNTILLTSKKFHMFHYVAKDQHVLDAKIDTCCILHWAPHMAIGIACHASWQIRGSTAAKWPQFSGSSFLAVRVSESFHSGDLGTRVYWLRTWRTALFSRFFRFFPFLIFANGDYGGFANLQVLSHIAQSTTAIYSQHATGFISLPSSSYEYESIDFPLFPHRSEADVVRQMIRSALSFNKR